MIQQTVRDALGSLRILRTQPGFSALVVLTLAVGIGATTAIFSVVNAVVIQALPFPDAHRLVFVSETLNEDPASAVPTSYLTYLDWARADSLADLAVFTPFNTMVMTGSDEALRLRVSFGGSNYLPMLGARPQLGRFFVASEDDPAAEPAVAVLSDAFWRLRFGGRDDVLGETVVLSGREYAVVGVGPQGFSDVYSGFPPDLWVPLPMIKQLTSPEILERRAARQLQVLGRLAPEASIEIAQQELNGIAAAIQEADPTVMANQGAVVVSMRQRLVGNLDTSLYALLLGSVFLLLVGCINVASLMLVRGAARAREVAIRQAMGASRRTLVRQFLTESMVLSVLGGALGVALATSTIGLLLSSSAVQLPSYVEVELDKVVLAVTAGVIVLAGIGFGLVPALRTTADDLGRALTEADLRTAGVSNQRSTNVLVIAEVAVATVLVVGSGLMIRSFQQMIGADLGFRVDNVFSVRVTLPPGDYATEDQVFAFRSAVVERLRAMPGVEFAGTWGPGSPGAAGSYTTVIVDGTVVETQLDADLARLHEVTPGLVRSLGVRLLAGRMLEPRDRAGSQPVALISEGLAATLWPGQDAVGQRLNHVVPQGRDPADYPPYEVVGVVANASTGGRFVANLGSRFPPLHDMYVPFEQRRIRNGISTFDILTGAAIDASALAEQVRTVVREVDSDVPVFNPQTLRAATMAELVVARFTAVLMGGFGAISLLLAAIGIYGILSQSVARRRREIGVRMALGAESSSTAWLVVGHGMRLSSIGIGVGLAAAFAVSRYASSLLYGVAPDDPLTLLGTAAILLTVALLASYVPTRRALGVDPVRSLRAE